MIDRDLGHDVAQSLGLFYTCFVLSSESVRGVGTSCPVEDSKQPIANDACLGRVPGSRNFDFEFAIGVCVDG